MTPGRASASGFQYSDPYGEDGGAFIADSDLFFWGGAEGGGAEGENASVSTFQWGDVAVIQPGAAEPLPSLYPHGYDYTPLSPTPLSLSPLSLSPLSLSPLSRVPSGSSAGSISSLGDIDQPSGSESASSPEPPQGLTRKRSRGAGQTVTLPSPQEPADRTVQIAGFNWTLPPDPGKGGPYPSLTFLIGAAISSSGTMTAAEIRQWIRARYPLRPGLARGSIPSMLSKQTDFIHIQTSHWHKGTWRLRNPQQFGSYYEKDIFLKHRSGVEYSNWELRSGQSTSKLESPGTVSPALSVKIGDHILTLPPYRAGYRKPPSKLLCGCAIAIGPEQGSSMAEITEWIAGYYSVQDVNGLKKIKNNTRSTLHSYKDDFLRTDIRAPRILKKGPVGMRWVLKNPAAFAVCYGASVRGDDTGRDDANPLSITPSSSRLGTVSCPGDIDQLSASESTPSPEPPRRLFRKRSRGAGQRVALPAPKKPADRTVQIAGFSWTLPPDPGTKGPYPSMIFLIGAAISSSESGMMTVAEISQWIRARYPSRTGPTAVSITNALTVRTDFIHTQTGTGNEVLWRLRDPQQFGSYYEKDIFLKRRSGVVYRNWALRNVRSASEQESPGAASPALSVRMGNHILMLPAYSADQRKPPIKLLCACAIALGPEQGTSVSEICAWIASRYLVWEASAKTTLLKFIQRTLRTCSSDFRRTDIRASRMSKKVAVGTRWALKNPAGFAASYGGHVCSQDS